MISDSGVPCRREGNRFDAEGVLREIFPISSYDGNTTLEYLYYVLGKPRYTSQECRQLRLTYGRPLRIWLRLNREEPHEEEVYLGDLPIMMGGGEFIINGAERVVVSQLIRSPGVYFEVEEERTTGRPLAMAKLIPDRGAWMEFETRKTDYLTVKFNRKRTVPVTLFLRALAAVDDGLGNALIKEGTDEEILALFEDVDTSAEHVYIQGSIDQEPQWEDDRPIAEQALIEFYKRMRPGDPPTLDNAKSFVQNLFFTPRRYDLGRVGRYKLNQRLGVAVPPAYRMVTKADLVIGAVLIPGAAAPRLVSREMVREMADGTYRRYNPRVKKRFTRKELAN